MKKTIHYALILDQSGSMDFIKKEVVSSFNEQVDLIMNLHKDSAEAGIKVTLCIFNDKVEYKYIDEDADMLVKLTRKDYVPNSTTALYDAIGITMLKLKEIKKKKDKVFIAVFTDGLENSSKEYNAADIRNKIKMVEKDGWEFQFFNRNEDTEFYKRELNLSDDMQFGISLNEEGFSLMEDEVSYKINKLMNE